MLIPDGGSKEGVARAQREGERDREKENEERSVQRGPPSRSCDLRSRKTAPYRGTLKEMVIQTSAPLFCLL